MSDDPTVLSQAETEFVKSQKVQDYDCEGSSGKDDCDSNKENQNAPKRRKVSPDQSKPRIKPNSKQADQILKDRNIKHKQRSQKKVSKSLITIYFVLRLNNKFNNVG